MCVTLYFQCCVVLVPGAVKKEVYFMAIIDILTHYDAKKKAAHAAKTVKHGVSLKSNSWHNGKKSTWIHKNYETAWWNSPLLHIFTSVRPLTCQPVRAPLAFQQANQLSADWLHPISFNNQRQRLCVFSLDKVVCPSLRTSQQHSRGYWINYPTAASDWLKQRSVADAPANRSQVNTSQQ